MCGDLQAIDGRTPLGDAAPGATNIFGDSIAERLTASYYLASDIDAAPTRDWDYSGGRLGFDSIGSGTDAFEGRFDGRGRLLRRLYVDAPEGDDWVGLFAVVGKDGSLLDVGLEDADVYARDEFGSFAGGLVGLLHGEILNSWASGRVDSGNLAGGLAGFTSQRTRGDKIALIRESWFAGEVVGDTSVGGLAGASRETKISDVWALANVRVNDNISAGGGGGLVARLQTSNFGVPTTVTNAWAGGSIMSGSDVPSGGLYGAIEEGRVDSTYWSIETSGIDFSAGDAGAIGVKTAQTLSVAQWSDAIWDFGDSDLSAFDGFAHFPALRALDRARQQIGASFGLTRILAVGSDAATVVVVDRNEMQTIDGAASVLVPRCQRTRGR